MYPPETAQESEHQKRKQLKQEDGHQNNPVRAAYGVPETGNRAASSHQGSRVLDRLMKFYNTVFIPTIFL